MCTRAVREYTREHIRCLEEEEDLFFLYFTFFQVLHQIVVDPQRDKKKLE